MTDQKRMLQNASMLVLLQLFAKGATIGLNFLTARLVIKEVYSYAHIQLQLYTSIILFF
jgi:O-antigen/teichoic acid export membrane protein